MRENLNMSVVLLTEASISNNKLMPNLVRQNQDQTKCLFFEFCFKLAVAIYKKKNKCIYIWQTNSQEAVRTYKCAINLTLAKFSQCEQLILEQVD